jgi:hypothetical protein
MNEPAIQYRWATPTRRGRWCATRMEAIDGAIRAGEASRDESDQVYWSVMTAVQSRPAPVMATAGSR